MASWLDLLGGVGIMGSHAGLSTRVLCKVCRKVHSPQKGGGGGHVCAPMALPKC